MIQGKDSFQTVVLTKYENLLKNASHNIFMEALVIKEVKYDWNEKMKVLQKKGYYEEVIINMKRKTTLI